MPTSQDLVIFVWTTKDNNDKTDYFLPLAHVRGVIILPTTSITCSRVYRPLKYNVHVHANDFSYKLVAGMI